MDYRLEPASFEDGKQIIDIFNHYVENSFAAYPESKVPYEFFQSFLKLTQGYPFLVAKDTRGRVVGFGCLRSYSPLPTFSLAAEITNFVSPEHVGNGIGQKMLDRLLEEGQENGDRHYPGQHILFKFAEPGLPQEERICGVRALCEYRAEEGAGVRRFVWMQRLV
jgi:L-amino acid N-acyltransferase YncA